MIILHSTGFFRPSKYSSKAFAIDDASFTPSYDTRMTFRDGVASSVIWHETPLGPSNRISFPKETPSHLLHTTMSMLPNLLVVWFLYRYTVAGATDTGAAIQPE